MSGQPTPGPWRSLGADPFGDHTITRHDDGLAIAAVVTNLRQQEEVEANARLIAAAPELLEAAKEVCRLAGRDGVNTSLAKAITKAEGRI